MPLPNQPDLPENKTAFLAGGSGLVGSFLLRALLDSGQYSQVISLGRRTLHISHPRLKQVASGFEELPNSLQADDYFCCLGTTIAKAGSKAEFRKVDLEYPLALGRVAKANNGRYFVVTALGADANSLFFYNQIKGELELELKKLDLPALHIFQPSLLVGNRAESRFGEKVAQTFSRILPFLFSGPFRKFRPIPASLVAHAMLKAAISKQAGCHIHQSAQMLSGE